MYFICLLPLSREPSPWISHQFTLQQHVLIHFLSLSSCSRVLLSSLMAFSPSSPSPLDLTNPSPNWLRRAQNRSSKQQSRRIGAWVAHCYLASPQTQWKVEAFWSMTPLMALGSLRARYAHAVSKSSRAPTGTFCVNMASVLFFNQVCCKIVICFSASDDCKFRYTDRCSSKPPEYCCFNNLD